MQTTDPVIARPQAVAIRPSSVTKPLQYYSYVTKRPDLLQSHKASCMIQLQRFGLSMGLESNLKGGKNP